MTEILIPRSVASRLHPLREALRKRDERMFRNQVELAEGFQREVSVVTRRRRMRSPEVMDAVLMQLVCVVQAAVPTEEWGEVGKILADELRSRLTVTGDNVDPRRMI